MCAKSLLSCPTLCDPMNYIACQAACSMGFSRQEYWSELPCPPPGDIPNLGVESKSLMSPSLAGRSFTTSITCESPPNQFSSVTQSCPTLCSPMDCSIPGVPVHHQLPELAQTHVYRVGDAVQLSHPLSSPSPPAFNLSQLQCLFQ